MQYDLFLKGAGAALMASACMLPGTAAASGDAMTDLLRILRDKGSIAQEEFELLQNAARADAERATAESDRLKAATESLPKIETKDKLEIASRDGEHKWRLGGRIHADAVLFDDDSIDISSGTQFRRARLDVDATLYRDWQLKFQYDFTDGGRAGIRDMFVRWSGWKPVSIVAGNFKQPFSLEELTSSNNITFMERSLANAIVGALLSRRVGIGATTSFADRVTLAGSVFSNNATVAATAPANGVDEGWGVAGRVTFVPWKEGANVLHLGAAASHIGAEQDRDMQGFSSRPETGFFSADTGDTGTLGTGALGTPANPVQDILLLGGEAALVYGPASLQGEYIRTSVDRRGLPDFDASGWYIEGSWFLTGESRPYSFGSGAFGSVKPLKVAGKGGLGAWQLALRYSSADFNDAGVIGGKEDNLTVGLNWYPAPTLRFMVNYVKVLDLDRPGDVQDNDEPGIVMFRSQAYW